MFSVADLVTPIPNYALPEYADFGKMIGKNALNSGNVVMPGLTGPQGPANVRGGLGGGVPASLQAGHQATMPGIAGGQVIGNDVTVTVAGQSGNFEINVMMPVAAYNLLQSITLLARATDNLVEQCVEGIRATDQGPLMVERGLMLTTSLAPVVGYDAAAEIAKEAYKTGRTIRELARFLGGHTTEAGHDGAVMADEPIAVIGMAVRLPGASDLAAFWDMVRTAGTGIEHFDAEDGLIGARSQLDGLLAFDPNITATPEKG